MLAVSDVHVCPSVWEEPLGNVVVEAKTAAVSSIVFPAGGLPELVCHLEDGYICAAKTQEELARGLRHFLDHGRDYAKELGANARASLERLGINRENFTQEWKRVYEQSA